MPVLIGLVGHCGPDSYMLRSAVKYAVKDSDVRMLNDEQALNSALEGGVALLLVNRVLDGDFPTVAGVELVKAIKTAHPEAAAMLISNYPDAQAQAEAAGALPGFGKSEVGSAKMKQLLADALPAV